MLSQSKILRGSLLLVAVLYGVELLDEFIYGLSGAVLPTIKTEFALTYTQVGLLFTLPGSSPCWVNRSSACWAIPVIAARWCWAASLPPRSG